MERFQVLGWFGAVGFHSSKFNSSQASQEAASLPIFCHLAKLHTMPITKKRKNSRAPELTLMIATCPCQQRARTSQKNKR
eukprot:1321370-Amphidinium_carterae.1